MPAAFVAEGDSCLAPYTAGYGVPPAGWPAPEAGATTTEPGGARAAPAFVVSAPAQLRWPDEPASLDRAVISPRLVRGIDEGLVTAGLSIFLGGYVGGLILGGVDQAARNCQRFGTVFEPSVACESWPYAFIPIVGGVLAGTINEVEGPSSRNPALGFALGLPLMAVQLFGLTLTGIALFGSTETMVPGARGGEPTISVLPYATDREAGTWLRIEL